MPSELSVASRGEAEHHDRVKPASEDDLRAMIQPGSHRWTPIMREAFHGGKSTAELERLIREGGDVNAHDSKTTALHLATLNGNLAALLVLLDNGAKVDAKNEVKC